MRARSKHFAATILVLIAILLCSCTQQGQSQIQAAEKPTVSMDLTSSLGAMNNGIEEKVINDAFASWLSAFVKSRIIPVESNVRGPEEFGPWTARKEYGTEDANDDGSLTEWYDNYYITHDWSEYGQQILSMQPGDVVTINGRRVIVEQIFNYPKQSFYDEVVLATGTDSVVFQTCYPDSDLNRIVYGR